MAIRPRSIAGSGGLVDTPTMNAFVLTINGRSHTVHVAPDTPLLWVLRDHVGLTGTKFGCGAGLCGACTVQLDGVPARSCSTPVSSIGTRRVTTIEGLSTVAPDGARRLHPVQTAWVAEQVPQCGYCQSGQLLVAAALLERTPRPTDVQIDEAMANICRCGTYGRIRAAIHRAAADIASKRETRETRGAQPRMRDSQ
jgi:isoquinoline 1-oxidoreductase alpha subunit